MNVDASVGALRTRGRLRGLVSLTLALVVIAATVGVLLVRDDSSAASRPPLDQATGPEAVGRKVDGPHGSRGNHAARPPREATIDAVNQLIDEQTFGDYYMLRIDPLTSAIVLLVPGDFPAGTLGDVRNLVAKAGDRLVVRTLVGTDSHPGVQEKLDRLAEKIREIATRDAAYGYSFLKLEVAWNTIVVWRREPDPKTDSDLTTLTDQAGATLELRTATFSRDDISRVGTELVDANARWRRHGFAVSGWSFNPWGALVFVTGSQENASRILLEDHRVLAIKDGEVIPL